MRWNKERQTVSLIALVLTCVFIAAKLTGYCAWTWMWVLSPVWVSGWILISSYVIYMVTVG